MRSNLHGIMSLTMISLAWMIALGYGLKYHFYIGLLCVTMTILGIVWILKHYCSKCPGRVKGCVHVLPGKAARCFKDQRSFCYSRQDIITIAVLILGITAFHVWLIRESMMILWIYIGLTTVGVVEIKCFVCPHCNNQKCPLNPNYWGRRKVLDNEIGGD